MSSTTSPSAAPRPDSLFTFVFEANSGDRWGGWLVADSILYAPGDTIAGALGRYVITLEEERGTDLSPFGLEDGEVRVEWYWDAGSAQFLVTRNGTGTVSGTGGLGSEVDAAWTSQGWVNFGRGGLLQVNVQENMRFSWVFEANSGDRLWGSITGIAGSLQVGQTIATAHGRYVILAEARTQPGDPDGATPGLVRTTRYFDAATGDDLPLESGGAIATGQLGLGSELDRVWTGASWVQVGQGGARQADGTFSLYTWRFEAGSGDRYNGLLFASALAYDPGDVITTAQGRYVIEAETPRGSTRSFTPGSVWIDSYFDARSGQTLKAYMPHTAFQPSLGFGLGNEQDWVWNGYEWAKIGQAGALQIDIANYGFFTWRFEANSGDRYTGFLYGDVTLYQPGQIVAATHGRYVIEAISFVSPRPAHAEGTVWINTYHDSRSGLTFNATNLHRLGRPSDGMGLGNERDSIVNGAQVIEVGLAGALQADILSYGFFAFRFEANSGDRYNGWVYGHTELHTVGQIIAATHGRYVIESLSFVSQSPAFADNTVWINTYYDSRSGLTFNATNLHRLGRPSDGMGLGNERDSIVNGAQVIEVGLAGALQADILSYGFFAFRFEANSGDRYNGWVYGHTELHTVGQIIAATHGRYVIESLSFVSQSPAFADNTVWINTYHDSRSGLTFNATNLHRLGRPSDGMGLGNERDSIVNGAQVIEVGLAGALQADILSYGFFAFRFEANSGDRYNGWVYGHTELHTVGQIIAATHGRYVIESLSFVSQSPAFADNTVWINTYYDSRSGLTFNATNLHRLGRPSDGMGLGNERDSIVNGAQVIEVGLAGALQADILSYGFFAFRFEANSGDRYNGWVYGHTELHTVGQIIAATHGRYVIESLSFVSQSPAFADNTVWINTYHDAQSGRTMNAYNLHSLGLPSQGTGLGQELDWVRIGNALVPVGQAGALQADWQL